MFEETAEEVRRLIIDVMGKNGGHLASNLGAVDFTIALHHVFDSPKDKLIFDTSHQCYTHKILTGRKEQFPTIRQYGGLCGFTHPEESEHDHFFAGHAGAALSLALGMAKSRDLDGGDEHIVPIIGDADLTCGLTMEALNNCPRDLKNFVFILNDNAMAIYKNVGAITKILSRAMNSPKSNRSYQAIKSFLNNIPGCGDFLTNRARSLKNSIKNMVSAAPFFEQYGLAYVGPVDGHNIEEMVKVFEAAKNGTKGSIIHLITEKGKGMESAVKSPISHHGVKPLDTTPSKRLTFPKVFGKKILQMAKDDDSIVAISPATPVGAALVDFIETYPERCIDVGIAEGHAVAYAGGLAKSGTKKVVVSVYATFLQRGLDNLFQEVCLQKLPVLFAIDRAGISGPDGSTHHGIYDIGFLNAMPNMVICQPRNGQLLEELIESAFTWNRPVALRYPNKPADAATNPLKKRELGKGEILHQGKEIALICSGHMIEMGRAVRSLLKGHNLDVTLIDPIFLKPLDKELFYSICQNHKHLVTIEEHSLTCGLGNILSSFIIDSGFKDMHLQTFGIPDRYIDHGDNASLLKEIGLTPERIAEEVLYDYSSLSQPDKARV